MAHTRTNDKDKYGNFGLNQELLNDLVFGDDIDNDKHNSQSKISNRPKKQSKKETIERQNTVSPTKLALTKAMNIDFDIVPDYISKANQSFEKKICSILPSTINIEESRKIALLIYKIISLQLVHSLWTIYQKSCMGNLQSTLNINNIDTKICPIEVQSTMKLCKFEFQKNDSDPYLTFVNYCLRQFNEESEQYRKHLNLKTSRLLGFTRGLECATEKFVQQGLISKRIEIDREIALVQYHYTDVLLKRAYFAQNPSENQIKIVKHLCKLKYDQEMTKHEANFLKQQIPIHITSHPFEKEPIAQLSLIDDISDATIRQQLYKEYKETAEQGRMKMMAVYLECAEEQKDRCQQQFNIELKQIWNVEKTLPSEQQLTPMIRNLMDQRLANITARIECLYKFKLQLIQIK